MEKYGGIWIAYCAYILDIFRDYLESAFIPVNVRSQYAEILVKLGLTSSEILSVVDEEFVRIFCDKEIPIAHARKLVEIAKKSNFTCIL
jgi:hypothetical protein